MIKLRKILLLDYLYYSLFIITIIISIIRLNIPYKSIYNKNTHTVVGKVTYIYKDKDKITLDLQAKEKLKVTYYYKEDINLSLGDKIKVIGEFNTPRTSSNKYLFNYQKYLERHKIYYIVKAKTITKISSTKNIYYILKNIVNKHTNNKYLKTFIQGDKNYLNDDVVKSYQENGISHLFAISGMHITLLSTIIKKILEKLKLEEETIYKITTIILLIYLMLVGLSPSILRGVIFYIIFTGNNIYYFFIDKICLFLLTISISLLINPYYIYDVGFQYSYLISLSLLLLSNNLKGNYIKSLFKTSLISFIVSIPISLYNFYQINLLSIIYNLFYVPLISIVIFPLTLLVFIIPKLDIIYNILITILESTSLYLSKINIMKLVFIRLPSIIYIIYLILIILYIFRNKRVYLMILLSLLIIHYLIPYISNNNYIRMIDVGQGDSILIHMNRKNILIDTGGIEGYNTKEGGVFYNNIYPTLKSKGIRHLDYLILSHGDKDHIGEAYTLVNNIKVDNVVFNVGRVNYLEKRLITNLKHKNITYYKNVDTISIGKTNLYFLNTKIYDNENDNSSVILFTYKHNNYLFMGDAGSIKEKDIIDEYDIGRITLLKVGHHGSNTSSSKVFINKIKPKISLISVGIDNKYKHPNKSTLINLKNSKIYRTDLNGSIEYNLNKGKIDTCK